MESTTTRRNGWKPAALVGVSVFLVLLALDVGVRTSLYNSNDNNNSAVAAVGSSYLRRFLQDFEFVDLGDDEGGNDEPSPLAEAVKDAIKEGMDSGEIGSNHDAIVNVSWVPLEDIQDDDTTEPPVARSVGDDGLDALWIVIICLGGALVLLLICLAFFCMRQAEREMDDDIAAAAKDLEDPNNNGAVTSAGEEDDDDEEEEESSEEEVAANDQPQVGSGDPNLGKFQVSNDNNVETYDEEIMDEEEESSSHNDPPANNQGVRFHGPPPGTSYEL
eukprot:scaffold5025_cov145-Amphora_coffeaeformis.AAC.3